MARAERRNWMIATERIPYEEANICRKEHCGRVDVHEVGTCMIGRERKRKKPVDAGVKGEPSASGGSAGSVHPHVQVQPSEAPDDAES